MGETGYEKTRGRVREDDGEFPLGNEQRGTYVRMTHEQAVGPKVVMAPGLGETAEGSFKEPARALAERGHDVYALTHPTMGMETRHLLTEKERMKNEWLKTHGNTLPRKHVDELFKKIPISEFRKALTLITFLETTVLSGNVTATADVIAHSQGGAYALIAAFLRPDLFRKLILVNPAGQSRQSFTEMFRKFHTTMFVDAVRTGKWKHVGDTLYSLLSHWGAGYIKAITQGFRLSRFNAYPYLEALNVIAPDVVRVTLYDSDDRIFKKERIEEAARIARGETAHDGTHGMRVRTEGKGHYGPITDPEWYANRFHELLSEPG